MEAEQLRGDVGQQHVFLLGAHRRIDMVSIEKRASTLGMVKSMGQEERFTQWRSEMETDIMVSLASLAGERLFFSGDRRQIRVSICFYVRTDS